MSFYTNLAATSARLIKDKGQSVTLVRSMRAAYTPAAGAPASAEESAAGSAVITDYPFKMIDGVSIRTGDRQALLTAEVDPNDYDQIVVGAERNEIVSVRAVSPGGTPVIYKVQLRRGGG